MKSFFQSAIFMIAMCSAATACAQTGFERIIVASGGVFEFAPPFTDYVTIKTVEVSTGATAVQDLIYTQSVQDIENIREESTFAVAAEDSLIVYNLGRRTTALRLQDSYGSLHKLYCSNRGGGTMTQTAAILWAGKWYGGNTNHLFYYTENMGSGIYASFTLGGTVANINYDVRGMAQFGDTLYVTQNIQNAQYADSVSYIAKVSLSTKMLLGEFGRTNPAFLGVSELHNYNGKIYGVCLNTNYIIEYTPTTGATRTIMLGTGNISKTLAFANNRVTVVQNGAQRYDITNGQLIEDLSCLTPSGETIAAGIDGVQTQSSGVTFPTVISTTDYATYGRTYLQNSACMTTTANVGVATEAMEVEWAGIVNTQTQADNTLFTLTPNPTTDVLNIRTNTDISGRISLKIVDILGRTLQNTDYEAVPSQISVGLLPQGLYFVQIQTEKGLFVQKIEKM